MSASKNTLNRKEVKYRLDAEQAASLAAAVRCRLEAGEYGRSRVNSAYLDTPAYDVIARSLEKPVYKEKLRVRWYGDCALEGAPCAFVELKKKFKGVVYKRRLAVEPRAAASFLEGRADAHELAASADAVAACAHAGETPPGVPGGAVPIAHAPHAAHLQIAHELAAAFARVQAIGAPTPSALVSCERTAYGADGEGGLRITFDEAIAAADLRRAGAPETPLAPGCAVMEVKCDGGFPPWLVDALNEARAYPGSFSKYGEFYRRLLAGEDALAHTQAAGIPCVRPVRRSA